MCCADTTGELEHKCRWLSTFGKAAQLGPSYLEYRTDGDEEDSLADMERRVESLLDAELPVLERCRLRKASAIVREARKKISSYKTALDAHRSALLIDGGARGWMVDGWDATSESS